MTRAEKKARANQKIKTYLTKMKAMSVLELVDGIESLKKRNPQDKGLILIAEREIFKEIRTGKTL